MPHASALTALLGAATALVLSYAPARAQMAPEGGLTLVSAPAAPGQVELLSPLVFHDARLQGMVEELERTSPTASYMLATIRGAGFPVAFGTFDDHHAEMQQEYRSWTRAPRSAAGYMAPVVRSGSGFSHPLTTVKINVAVNLEMLDELFDSASDVPEVGYAWEEIRRLETLAVLAHELVHAYGLAVSGGDPRHGCHDPTPEDERPEDSCVMIGENVVRAEIGAPLDWDYGFPSLAVLARRYAEHAATRQALLEIASFRKRTAPWPALPARAPLGF